MLSVLSGSALHLCKCFCYAHKLSCTGALKPGVEGRVNMRCSVVSMMDVHGSA